MAYQSEACFFDGEPLEPASWLRSKKKLTLILDPYPMQQAKEV